MMLFGVTKGNIIDSQPILFDDNSTLCVDDANAKGWDEDVTKQSCTITIPYRKLSKSLLNFLGQPFVYDIYAKRLPRNKRNV